MKSGMIIAILALSIFSLSACNRSNETNYKNSLQEEIDANYKVERKADFVSIESFEDGEYVLLFRIGNISSIFLQLISNAVTANNGVTISVSTGKVTESTVATSFAKTLTVTEGWENIPYQLTGTNGGVNVTIGSIGIGGSAGTSWVPAHTVLSGSTSTTEEISRTESFSEAVSFEQSCSFDLSDNKLYERGQRYAIAMFADISVYQRFSFRDGDTHAKAIDRSIVYSFVNDYTYYDIYKVSGSSPSVSYREKLEALQEVTVSTILSNSLKNNTRTITLNVDGGNALSKNTRIVMLGASYGLPIPILNNNAFVGWYASPNGQGKRYTNHKGESLANWSEPNNMTLHAHWVELLKQAGTTNSTDSSTKDGRARVLYDSDGVLLNWALLKELGYTKLKITVEFDFRAKTNNTYRMHLDVFNSANNKIFTKMDFNNNPVLGAWTPHIAWNENPADIIFIDSHPGGGFKLEWSNSAGTSGTFEIGKRYVTVEAIK